LRVINSSCASAIALTTASACARSNPALTSLSLSLRVSIGYGDSCHAFTLAPEGAVRVKAVGLAHSPPSSRRMRAEPVLQRRINLCLPPVTCSPKCLDYIG
jgi:hypothetical protein